MLATKVSVTHGGSCHKAASGQHYIMQVGSLELKRSEHRGNPSKPSLCLQLSQPGSRVRVCDIKIANPWCVPTTSSSSFDVCIIYPLDISHSLLRSKIFRSIYLAILPQVRHRGESDRLLALFGRRDQNSPLPCVTANWWNLHDSPHSRAGTPPIFMCSKNGACCLS